MSQELGAKPNCSPPPLLFFYWHFFPFSFFSCFPFSLQSLIGSSEFCSSFLLPSPSIKILLIRKLGTFFLPSLPANCLFPSGQVSRINKLTFRKITQVQVGCLRGESLNIRWSIRLQKVSIKVTVEAAFACPERFAFIVRAVLGAASISGREVWFPLSAFCVLRSAAATVLIPANNSTGFSVINSTVKALKYGKEVRSLCPIQAGIKEPTSELPSPNAPHYPVLRKSRIRPTTFSITSSNPARSCLFLCF